MSVYSEYFILEQLCPFLPEKRVPGRDRVRALIILQIGRHKPIPVNSKITVSNYGALWRNLLAERGKYMILA